MSRIGELKNDTINEEIQKYIDRGEIVNIEELKEALTKYKLYVNNDNLQTRCNNMNAKHK